MERRSQRKSGHEKYGNELVKSEERRLRRRINKDFGEADILLGALCAQLSFSIKKRPLHEERFFRWMIWIGSLTSQRAGFRADCLCGVYGIYICIKITVRNRLICGNDV